MAKVSLESHEIKTKEVWKVKNLTQVVVSNFSATSTTFIYNGIERVLPAFDAATKLPVGPFQISDNGNDFDLELKFLNAEYNIIIDYSVLIDNDQC